MPTLKRRCARCGEPFVPARSDARYCSGRSRTAVYRKRATRRTPASADSVPYGARPHARRERDTYDTPPDVAEVLAQEPLRGLIAERAVWEPAAGAGALLPTLRAAGAASVIATDLVPRARGIEPLDFLGAELPLGRVVVTNPPFAPRGLVDAFVRRSVRWVASDSLDACIFLLRAGWADAGSRRDLFDSETYAGSVALRWRPRWVEGTDGNPRFSYVWHLWSRKHVGTPGQWWAERPEAAG